MGRIGCVYCEKSGRDFVARTFALIALVHPVSHWISSSNEPMGRIGCVRCNKFWHDFVARNFALIAPAQYVLHHVSCGYEIIRNELKHYATHENMKLGSNGMDQVHLLRKIKTWLRGTNFCINCTSSPRFAPSFMQLRNDPKCTQTLWNTQKHKFRVQRDGSVC